MLHMLIVLAVVVFLHFVPQPLEIPSNYYVSPSNPADCAPEFIA